jgi:hypothetical protein
MRWMTRPGPPHDYARDTRRGEGRKHGALSYMRKLCRGLTGVIVVVARLGGGGGVVVGIVSSQGAHGAAVEGGTAAEGDARGRHVPRGQTDCGRGERRHDTLGSCTGFTGCEKRARCERERNRCAWGSDHL